MKIEKISYRETGRFAKIVTDYLEGSSPLRSFYKYEPNIDSIQEAMNDKLKENIGGNKLADNLLEQYSQIDMPAKVFSNINLFRNKNTFCVVTAHQLNIFTGPLYYIYKTISTIQLCNTLNNKYPENNFVPVFWLGSEDHDFAEINHFQLYGKTYTWDDVQGGVCGKYNTDSLQNILHELIPVLGDTENAHFLISLFKNAYSTSKTLAEATRTVLSGLFGEYGLVVVDGDDSYFKKSCNSIIESELLNRNSEKLVNETLSKFPYEAQATPREINLFYKLKNIRERILYDNENNKFKINNTEIVFTAEEMQNELKLFPERFSPNVILRPLFQQKVLPSVAFIGGGGEIAYWMQLKKLFEFHEIQFPILLLRNSYLLIDASAEKKITKLQLSPTDLFKDEHILINDFVNKHSSDDLKLSEESQQLEQIFNAIQKKAQKIDITLDKAVLGEKHNMLTVIQKLEGKLLKAEKIKMDAELGQIRSILTKLFPNNSLQEREENFISYFLKHGKIFFEMLLEQSEQPSREFKILYPDNI